MSVIDRFGIDLARERLPLLVVFGITLVAKAGALLPGYGIDDYGPSADGPAELLGDVLSKGRFGHWVFLTLAQALQVEPNAARILLVLLSIAAYAVFGLAVIRFWGIRGHGWLALAAAAVVANHPYTCEIFTFRIGLPLAGLVMAVLTILLWIEGRPTRRPLLGALAFAAALSVYPIALHFALMIVLVGMAIELARDVPPSSLPTLLAGRNIRLLRSVAAGTVLYALVGIVLGLALGVSGGYFEAVPLTQIPGRLADAARHVARTFVAANVLVPPLVQAVFALVAGALLLGLVRRAVRRPLVLGVVPLLLTAALWSVGISVLLKTYWPVPRNMAHVGILWAGVLLLAPMLVPGRWVARGVGAAAAVIVLAFVGVNQHILTEQHRLNTRDLLQANRIVARLETLPGFERTRRVVVVGQRAWYPMGLQRTQWGDMNISAFGATWSQLALLREASGYDLRWSPDPRERAAAAAYCAEVAPWPAERSVALRDGVAFICLGQG